MKKVMNGLSLVTRSIKGVSLGLTCVAAVACSSAVMADNLRLKFAGTLPVEHQGSKIMEQIADEIEAADVGLKVSVFPANQLGSGEELLEDAIRGNIDLVMGFIYSHKDPTFEINSMPYLVSSWDEMEKTVRNPDSAFNQIISERLTKLGLRLIDNNPEGFSNLVAQKKPQNVAGLGDKGVNIRVWSSNAVKDSMEAMGYNTTTMAYAEIFAAVQSGVVDGAICCTKQSAHAIFAKSGVGKYFVDYNAFMELTTFYGSQKTWDKMNDEQKKVVQAAFDKASDEYFKWNKANDEKYAKALIEAGYEIVTPTPDEIAILSEKVRATVWPTMADVVGQDVIDRLQADLK
ncbi:MULTISPECIES: TRAP transporter substrate-binding protein DctP [unclassified Vibrio]|uniref:TRAP transporter substrate-binding protein DctP n=1 Tax=Vibrio sp. HB236076 TaxID=3232307 RepID=A0AB39HIW5_9VIBR|nr:TRAP transporter substrate-binding protein DctP [Vibrio sp. HB161653]MDP5254664.1 TRAP transporter substrate-binding protein DctP [Vibrio sp. HB161653]